MILTMKLNNAQTMLQKFENLKADHRKLQDLNQLFQQEIEILKSQLQQEVLVKQEESQKRQSAENTVLELQKQLNNKTEMYHR